MNLSHFEESQITGVKPTISVIIPAQNEQDGIAALIVRVIATAQSCTPIEVIVAVNGSDHTADFARQSGAIVVPVGSSRSQAMNGGAEVASSDILYFLHADSLLPNGWDAYVIDAHQSGYNAGCFRLRFDSTHPLLQFSAWLTRFNWKFIRFGDQSLFVSRSTFILSGKFNNEMKLFEDQEILDRILPISRFKVMPQYITTSARKYEQYGCWKLQLVYVIVNILYYARVSQPMLVIAYNWLLRRIETKE
jgi:rSAM/selenodomain-associated transferase 2